MSRIARFVVPGCPHHIVQRGNRQQTVFFNDQDKAAYLELFSAHREKAGIEIWAYCLMDNHVHFVAVPRDKTSFAKGMGIVHKKYTRMILPDHSRSFRTGGKWTKELFYTEKHKEGPMVMRELPRAFYENIKSLNFEIIKDFVGEYLADDEINAVLARKDLIIKEIEKLIQQNGEDKVLC